MWSTPIRWTKFFVSGLLNSDDGGIDLGGRESWGRQNAHWDAVIGRLTGLDIPPRQRTPCGVPAVAYPRRVVPVLLPDHIEVRRLALGVELAEPEDGAAFRRVDGRQRVGAVGVVEKDRFERLRVARRSSY